MQRIAGEFGSTVRGAINGALALMLAGAIVGVCRFPARGQTVAPPSKAPSDEAKPATEKPTTEKPVRKIELDHPGEKEFVLDRAKLLKEADLAKINALCEKLLADKATPIVVVTIDSMAEHGGKGLPIETFATLLFDQWGIGHAKLDDKPWNTGILLLVSKGDRKARIELGGYWKRDKDATAKKIMDGRIVPKFKAGDFSAGIAAGVESLEKMAREHLP